MQAATETIFQKTIRRPRRVRATHAPPSPKSAPSDASLPFDLYTPQPGHPDWDTLFAEARAMAAELRPKLAKPETARARALRQARAYKTTMHNYATNFRLNRQGREDFRPLYFIWTMLRTCNFECTYCDDHRGEKYPDLPNKGVLTTEEGRRLLEVMRTRTPSVYFAGGEPTVRRDLPEMTRYARELNYFPIIINTNGSLVDRIMSREDGRSWLADTDVVVVSLDALGLEGLRDLWVFKRPEVVIRNLLLLRELAEEMQVKLMVNTVIRPGHVSDAREVLDLACDLGIWFCPVPMNVGPRVHDGLAADPEYQDLVKTILERKRAGYLIAGSARLNERLLKSEPVNCRNTLKPHIDYDGKLYWPCKATVNVPPATIDVLDYDDVDSLYDAACERIEPTRFHGPACNQCGAECNWAQNYTTDAYAHGLSHPLSLVREVTSFLKRG